MLYFADWVSPAMTVLMPAFVLACGLLLPTYLKQVKQGELDKLDACYVGIAQTRSYLAASQAADRFSLWHYVIPVAFTTFQVAILSYLTHYGARFAMQSRDFILGGADVATNVDYQNYALMTLCTVSFAFLGAFIWMIQNLITRIMARNINPATFYAMSINIVLATTVAAVLHHIYHGGIDTGLGLTNAADAPAIMIALGFLTGMAPDVALDKIRTGLKFSRSQQSPDHLPVTVLQGISSFTEFRMKEMGLESVQNLAQANPVELFMMNPASIQACLDWVGQAQLRLLLADKVSATVPLGIRTSLDFWFTDAAVLAPAIGWNADQITAARQRLMNNPAFAAAKELNDLLLSEAGAEMTPISPNPAPSPA